jgi:WD40 repeat protein/serine/threonine protein kinase/class 3 adenylate cyclase
MDVPDAAPDRARVEEFRRKHHTGLVTLVFTDLVDSVALRRHLGDQAATTLLQTHRQLVRDLLRRAVDAEEIETAGDSFLLLFARPSDAVKFALLLEQQTGALAKERTVVLAVRIGIHVGEVVIEEHRQGPKPKDLYGSQIDLCARVMSLAQGRQILLTRAVFDSARQALKGEELQGLNDLQWLDHGPYVLKGIEEPVDICEVGEVEVGVLKAPSDSDKAKRKVSADEESVLGWRPAVGQVIPHTRWVLEKKLGEGGFGEVWLGRNSTTKQWRVFKFCFQAERVRFLKRELTLFRLLKERVGDHPNIVALHDVHLEKPPFYVEMEYVEGADLRSWCEEHGGIDAIPLATRLEIVAHAADGLQAAHEAGIIHRDIKPANILIGGKAIGQTEIRVKLTDFGIGQVVSEESLQGITRAGFTQTIMSDSSSSRTGTQLYMAPELLAGKPASTRSDLYSLGVVLYQMLVADFTRPVAVDWANDIADPLLREDLRHCFAGNPQERFAGAAQLARHLRALPERRVDLAERSRAERRRTVAKLAAVVAAILVVLALALSYGLVQSKNEALKARENLYAAHMLQAQRAWAEGNLGLAVDLLNKHRPLKGQTDLRGWEWRYLWGACRSQEITSFTSTAGNVFPVAMSPDGSLLAAVCGLGVRLVKIWRYPSGEPYDTPEPNDSVASIAFSPDGKLLAFGTCNRGLVIWDVAAHKERIRFPGKFGDDHNLGGYFRAALFSSDGRTLAASSIGSEVLVFDLEANRLKKSLTNDFGPVSSLAFSRNGTELICGGKDGGIRMWSLTNHVETTPVRHQTAPIRALAVLPDDKTLVSASWDGTIRVWDLDSMSEVRPPLTNHTKVVSSLALSRDGRILASASTDFTIRLWDTASWQEVNTLHGNLDEVWAVVFAPDDKTIISGAKDGAIKIWNATPKGPAVDVLKRPPDTMQWGLRKEVVFCIRTNGTIQYWNPATLGLAAKYVLPEAFPRTKAVGFDLTASGKLAWAESPGSIVVWDLGNQKEVCHLPWTGGESTRISISPDDRLLAAISTGKPLQVWDLKASALFATLPTCAADPYTLHFSPDTQFLAAGNLDGTADLWNLARRAHEAPWQAHRQVTSAVEFLHDGKKIVTVSHDSTAKIWDIRNQRTNLLTMPRTMNAFRSLAVSPDGKRIAAGDSGGLIKIWSSANGEEVATLKSPDVEVTALEFLPQDGNALVSQSATEIRLWRAPSFTEIETAEDRRTHGNRE